MICNLVGVIGGLEISRLLGETGVHASWVAAAFSYVTPLVLNLLSLLTYVLYFV